MNLDELQIKISIELDDLNKQLKSITKGIDEALGPKATKKLMADNNKVVKSGLTAINKTTLNLVKKSRKDTTKEVEAMSKDINKSLTKAFDIDLTKFNSNITSAMNQARITVRSACNDIKRELNAALNIKGSIRITGKASMSGSATGSSDSNVASNMASSQYIGAMIIKATNAIIAENKANTLQLKQEINQSTNKIVSAIRKINTKTIQADSNKIARSNSIPVTKEDPVAKTNNDSVKSFGFELVGAGKAISAVTKDMVNAHKAFVIINRNLSALNNLKSAMRLGAGSYGSNQLIGGKAAEGYVNFTRGGTGVLDTSQIEAMKYAFKQVQDLRERIKTSALMNTSNFELGEEGQLDTSQVEAMKKAFKQVRELMKQIHNLGKGIPSDTTSFTIGEEQSQSLTGKVIDSEKLTKNKGIPQKEVIMADSFKVIDDELAEVIRECVERIQKFSKNALAPGFELRDEGSQTLRGKVIDKAKNSSTQRIGVKDVIEGTFREVEEVLPPVIEKAAEEIEKVTTTIRKATGAMPGSKKNPTKADTNTSKQGQSFVYSDKGLSNNVFKGAINNTDKEAPKNAFEGAKNNSTSAAEQVQDTMQKIKNTWENAESMDLVQGVVDAIDVAGFLVNPIKEGLAQVGKVVLGELTDLGGDFLDLNESPLNSPKKLGQPLSSKQPTIDGSKELGKPLNSKPVKKPKDVGLNNTPDVTKFSKKVEYVKYELQEMLKEISSFKGMEIGSEELDGFKNQVENLMKRCKSFKTSLESLKVKVDSEDLEDAERGLKSYQHVLIQVKKDLERVSKKKNKVSDIDTDIYERQVHNPPINIADYGDDNTLGFLPYRNEIDSLIEYAKKAGAKIKEAISNSNSQTLCFAPYQNELHELGETAKKIGAKIKNALSKAGSGIKGIFKGTGTNLLGDFGNSFDSHVAVQQAGELKEKLKKSLDKIKANFKKTASEINKLANKLTAPFKKIASILNNVASSTKSAWSKITGIFKKGANDAVNATNKLSIGLKDLLKQALGFVSLYGLINLGKQAVTQSQELAQAEIKLTSLMKQRMGATNDTVLAIRQLAEEQARLGVVSETAMKRGAEQLARYVHSAKALKELMPAIANLTAARGGLNATPDDAEEIATQLGEAIREGTTTPLEQSGIYLSEKEIEKFSKLKTEEDRAEFLARRIAQDVGDINEALAKTPHGQITKLKNNFQSLLSTLGIFLANVIQPIVKWLNVIVVACNNALKALGKLLGFDMTGGTLEVGDLGTGSTEVDTGGVEDVTDSLEDTTDAAEEAEEAVEKFKGSLAGFDEINILTDNTDKKEDDPTDITPGEGGQLTPEPETFPTLGELIEGENLFGKFGDKMKAFIDEVLEPFKNAWALLGDDLKAEWADLQESFKNFCDKLAQFLKSVWENGGKEFVQHMAEIALAVAKAAMEIGGEILDALARLWEHLDPKNNEHTQRFLDYLNDTAEKLRDFLLGLGDHFESLMANGGQDVLNALGDCFMDLGAAAVKGLGLVIDALDGLIDHLDPAVNENTKNMLQALADMFHAVGQTALDFVDLLESCLLNGGQDMINAFGDMMMNLGQATAEVITTIMESFSALFKYLDPATNDITKHMMKAWEEAFLAIGQAALGFSELFDSIMKNGGQEALNALADAFNSLIALAGTVTKEVAEAFDALFEHLDPRTNEFTKGMLEAWKNAFEGITELCQTLEVTLGSFMDNGGQDLLNSLGDLAMQVSELLAVIVDEVAECMTEFFTHMDPGKNENSKGALEALKYFVDSIRDFVDMLGRSLDTFMENGGQEFVNNIGDIIAILVDLGATVAGDLINSITAFFDSWLGHAVISACATALELITEVLEALLKILKPLSPIISAVVAAIGGFIVAQKVIGFITPIVEVFKALAGSGGLLALAKGAFTALWGVIAANPIAATVAAIVAIGVALVALYNKCEGFREFVDNVLKGFVGFFEEFKQHFSTLLEDIKAIFQNVIDIIVGIFTGDGEKVGTAVRELIGNIINLFLDLNKAFVEVGWELIKGLANGIWEAIKAIPSLLKGIGEFVVDFFKGLFGIHSPSTVFAEIGVNLIEGLIEGIESSITALKDAIAAVGDAIFGTVKEVVSFVADKWKELYDTTVEKWNSTKEIVVTKCSDIYNSAKEKYQSLKDTVADSLESVRKSSEEKWNTVKQKTSDIVSNIRQDVEEKYSKFKDMLSTHLENWRQSSETIWGNIKEKTSSFVSDIKTDVEDKYEKLKDKITDCVDKVKQHSEDTWGKVKDKTIDFASKIKSDVEDKYESLKNALTDKLNTWKKSNEDTWKTIKETGLDTFDKLRTTGVEAFETLKTNLSSNMDALKSKLTSAMEEIRNDLVTKWEDIKTKAIDAATKVKTDVENAYNELKSNLGSKLEEVRSEANKKWSEIKSATTTSVKEVVTEATNRFGEMKESFTKKIDEVKNALTPKWTDLKNSVKTNAQGVATKVTEGLSGLKQKFTKPFEEAQSTISSIITKIGNTLKNTNWSLPKIKLPHISVSGKFSLDPPSVPSFSIQWYKRGGIIDGLTPLGFANGSLHMGGEAGKEMVVPLENTSFTSKIAQAMGQAVDNALARQANPYNNNNNSANDNRDIVLQIHDREFARASINSINKLQRESGKTLLDI